MNNIKQEIKIHKNLNKTIEIRKKDYSQNMSYIIRNIPVKNYI